MVLFGEHGWRCANARHAGRLRTALATVVVMMSPAIPVDAQERADTARTGRHRGGHGVARTGRELPPVRITKGPALPVPMVAALRRDVHRAITESRRPTAPTRTLRRERLACALRRVSIELESGDFPGSSVAATVTGFAQASTGGPSVAFALLYVHPAPAAGGRSGRGESPPGTAWRLTLARVRPETPSATEASGRDAEWQALWSVGPEAAPPHPCLIEDAWRRVGR